MTGTFRDEFHPTKNDIPLDSVKPHHRQLLWWQCRNDTTHEWQAYFLDRLLHKRGAQCPACRHAQDLRRKISEFPKEIRLFVRYLRWGMEGTTHTTQMTRWSDLQQILQYFIRSKLFTATSLLELTHDDLARLSPEHLDEFYRFTITSLSASAAKRQNGLLRELYQFTWRRKAKKSGVAFVTMAQPTSSAVQAGQPSRTFEKPHVPIIKPPSKKAQQAELRRQQRLAKQAAREQKKREQEQELYHRVARLLEDLHPRRNGEVSLPPETLNLSQFFWWQCSTNRTHTWKTSIRSRLRDDRCPHCEALADWHTLYQQTPALLQQHMPTPPLVKRSVHIRHLAEWLSFLDVSRARGILPQRPLAEMDTSHLQQLTISDVDVFLAMFAQPDGVNAELVTLARQWYAFSIPLTDEAGLRERLYEGLVWILDDFVQNSWDDRPSPLRTQWMLSKNRGCDVTQFQREGTRLWWRCSDDASHLFKASIAEREADPRCPLCIVEMKSLFTQRLLDEWDFLSNLHLVRTQMLPNDPALVTWRCRKRSHTWKARLKTRLLGAGCPHCEETMTFSPRLQVLPPAIQQLLGDRVIPAHLADVHVWLLCLSDYADPTHPPIEWSLEQLVEWSDDMDEKVIPYLTKEAPVLIGQAGRKSIPKKAEERLQRIQQWIQQLRHQTLSSTEN